MLVDASISRADVSKAKPQCSPACHRGARTPTGGRTVGPARGGGGGAAYRLQKWSSNVEEEGQGPPSRRRAGGGGGATSGRCASVRADVGTAELAGGGRRSCVRVGE
jgi:hypothetical protein